MQKLPSIGFLGTGMIATAMITGFCEQAKDTPYPINVANRTPDKAQALSEKYPDRVTACVSFQECVDKSDWVVISVLPQAAEEVLKELTFTPEHKIISVIFSMPEEKIAPLLNCKVDSIVHMVPGTFVSVTKGPIVQRPKHPEASEIFGHIGTMVAVDDKKDEEVLISLTGMFAPVFSVEDAMISWCESKGLSGEAAAHYVTALFCALSDETRGVAPEEVHTLATVNTPGGINMQAVDQITNAGGFKAFGEALDGILARIRG